MYEGLEVLLFGGLLIVSIRRHLFFRPNLQIKINGVELLFGIVLVIALFFFFYRFLIYVAANPLGGWDAWARWNARARYLLLGDAITWRNVFSAYVSQADYPFLLSGFIARCWVLLGREYVFVPVVTAGIFSISIILVLVLSLAALRNLSVGLFGGFILASLPHFAWSSATLLADVPLALYFLVSIYFLSQFFFNPKHTDNLLMVGITAGLALWTKNEGASLVLSIFIVLLVCLLRLKVPFRQSIQMIFTLIMGLFPFLLLFLGYKFFIAPSGFLFRDVQSIPLRILAVERYRIIGSAVWNELFTFGGWKLPFPLMMIGYSILVGVRSLNPAQKNGALAAGAVLMMIYLQYLAVFVITPYDLEWQIMTSLTRLYNQLLPGVLLTLLLIIKIPFSVSED